MAFEGGNRIGGGAHTDVPEIESGTLALQSSGKVRRIDVDALCLGLGTDPRVHRLPVGDLFERDLPIGEMNEFE